MLRIHRLMVESASVYGRKGHLHFAFHQREANPLLVKYFDVLSPSKGSFCHYVARRSTFIGCFQTPTALQAPS